MRLLRCLLTENDCYRAGRTIAPKGIMVHSTGADNPNLKRYVQPLPESPDYDSLTALLGINRNHNDWNRPNVGACVHAFIGRLEDGTLAVCQTLPWTMRGWHCGADGNNTHISFEICEDGLEPPVPLRPQSRWSRAVPCGGLSAGHCLSSCRRGALVSQIQSNHG